MIQITDVTLRDGLQMEVNPVPLEEKLALYSELSQCGYQRLEVTSFVHPKWVPQFKDAEEFLTAVYKTKPQAELMAFVPNTKGMERFVKFPLPWASVFVAATETFNQKNVNAAISETLADLKNVVDIAKKENRKIRIYISTVFGCPYEGKTDSAKLKDVLKQVAELDPHEIALSDTIGVAIPEQVHRIVSDLAKVFPTQKTALHLHNTYGMGLMNAQAGFQAGIRLFDGSTGGIGGCPYARGATGNVASDEIQYFFSRAGETQFTLPAQKKVYERLRGLNITVHSHLAEIVHRGGNIYGIQ